MSEAIVPSSIVISPLGDAFPTVSVEVPFFTVILILLPAAVAGPRSNPFSS